MDTQERTSTLMKCDQLVIWMAIVVIMRIIIVIMILITMEIIVMTLVICCDQYIMLVMPWRSCVCLKKLLS